MSNSSTKPSVPHTLDMFSIESAAPQIHNPELGVRRVQIDGTWFFSIIDIFSLYGDTTSPRQEWRTVEGFLIKQGAIDAKWADGSGIKNIQLLMHKFEGQGQRKTPVATFKMIMRIAQATTFKEWESARDQMAQLAQERVEEIHNPELGVDRSHKRFIQSKMNNENMTEAEAYRALAAYLDSTAARNDLTSSMKDTALIEPTGYQYAEATNVQYTGMFGMKAKRIAELTGVSPAKHGLTEEGRQTLMLADTMIARKFRESGKLSHEEQITIVRHVAAIFGASIRELEQVLGMSLVTGRKTLGSGL